MITSFHRSGPGTFLWLVVHDLRLNWRRFVGMFGGVSPGRALALAAIGAVALHGLAVPALPLVGEFMAGAGTTPEHRLGLAALLVSVLSWMMAQGLFAATRTLYDRSDLDLLLGSPLSPSLILGAKATAIALSSLGSVAMLVLPIVHVGALFQDWRWLAAYPTLAALALLATAFSLAATMILFRCFGARRARQYAHLGGALVGGSFVLAAQVVAMLPESARDGLVAMARPAMTAAASGRSIAARAVSLPVDALLADGPAILALLALGVLLFAATVLLLGVRFAQACLEAAGAPAPAARDRLRAASHFRPGAAAALRRKEWRLLARDPSLFAQLSLQIIYTIPLAVVLLRSGTLPMALALAPAIVVIAAQVSASLAWIAVSGEDAPELIQSAPVGAVAVDAAKLSAIAVPVVAVAALPVAGLAFTSPGPAVVALGFAAGASLSTALLNLWHPMPGNRRGMLRRHAQSKLIGLIEHVLAVLWAIAVVLALLGSWLWPIPVAGAVLVLGCGRLRRSTPRRSPSKPAVALARVPGGSDHPALQRDASSGLA